MIAPDVFECERGVFWLKFDLNSNIPQTQAWHSMSAPCLTHLEEVLIFIILSTLLTILSGLFSYSLSMYQQSWWCDNDKVVHIENFCVYPVMTRCAIVALIVLYLIGCLFCNRFICLMTSFGYCVYPFSDYHYLERKIWRNPF